LQIKKPGIPQFLNLNFGKEIFMVQYFADNSFSIGNTPLVKINKLAQGLKATILGKIEGRNPSYSVKCRIGASMIWAAEKQGLLKPGMEIIEPTSGNTGIALAFVAAARGYKLNVTMPETMSMERRKVLAIFGTNIILTPGAKGMKGAVEEAERIAGLSPNYYMPQQFNNPANPEIHFKTTGPEIWEQTKGGIDVLVSGVGTGGTITGVSRYIKGEKKKKIISVAVEPVESPVITQRLAGQELKPGPHKIQGIGAGFIPDTLDLTMVDRVEQVTSEEAIAHARRLAREEGILSGVSSGAAVAVAVRLARSGEFNGKTIVAVLPDSGERYLTGPLFEGLFDEAGLPRI
jgi:cysteine synthase A